MKTYKTWEAIKMLTENPKFQFRRAYDDLELSIDPYDKSYLNWKAGHRRLAIDDEWTLAPQPVSFMEAVKALREQQEPIYCNWNNEITCYSTRLLKDKKKEAITAGEILYGTWYIGEPEE